MSDETFRYLVGAIALGSFIVLYCIELFAGRITNAHRPLRDLMFALSGIFANTLLGGLLIGTLAGLTISHLFPAYAGSLRDTNFWLVAPPLFLLNEFCHYWIHRKAHEWRWLWKIHRTHHSITDINTSALFRYNIFWVLLLPQVWFGTFVVFMGQAEAFAAATLTTFFVNMLTHVSFRWDLFLREKLSWSEPFWRVLENIITLPDTHHAHHAYGEGAHPNGNYAVTLFIFDTLFGTAKIPNRKQTQFGLPISNRLHWAEELFWPVIKKPLLAKTDEADPT